MILRAQSTSRLRSYLHQKVQYLIKMQRVSCHSNNAIRYLDLKQQMARIDAEFIQFKEYQQNKYQEIEQQLSNYGDSIPNTQELQSRVLARCSEQNRHGLATQSSKRELLSHKISQVQAKAATNQSDISNNQVQISLAQEKLSESIAKQEQHHKHYIEIKRELSTLQLLIKQKDYDNKINLIQTDFTNLHSKYKEQDEQINELRTLIQLNNTSSQLPQLNQFQSHPPRDHKAIQSILTTLNQHKNSIEKHQVYQHQLNKMIDRLQVLQAENVQILSLSSRIQGLQQLKNQIADLRQAFNAHQRIYKVEINKINEQAKNYDKDNRVQHETMLNRIIELEKSIDLIQTKITHIDPLEEHIKLLRVKTRENAANIEEYARNCRHNRLVAEKRIEAIQIFIDKKSEETNINLDSNMKQFQNAIYDIDQRIDKLNLNQKKLRKKSTEQSRQFALMETYLAKKEDSPSVISVTKSQPNIKINSPSKVQASQYSRRVVSIEEQSAQEAGGGEYQESDQDAEIDEEDRDERATPGTPGRILIKSMSSLPIASHSRGDQSLYSSRYNFQLMQFHSPARYFRKTGPQYKKDIKVEMDNYPIGQKFSNYSEQNFRRSQYFNPDQAISYSIAKSQTPISQSSKYVFQSNSNIPSRDISSAQSLDGFKTPLRPISSQISNIIQKNYQVKDEQEMKSIINQEISDLMLQKQGKNAIASTVDIQQTSRTNLHEFNQQLRRSVSPVEMLKPLDEQSQLLKSFLSGQKIPQTHRKTFISGRDILMTPQRTKRTDRSRSGTPSRPSKKYRGGDQKHQRCISGTVIYSRKIFKLDEENNIWHQNREKKLRHHSQKYFQNIIHMYNSGSQPSTSRFQTQTRPRPSGRSKQQRKQDYRNNLIDQSKLQQQKQELDRLYRVSNSQQQQELQNQDNQNQKFQYPDRLRSDDVQQNKNYDDSGYQSFKLGDTADAVSAASRLTPMAGGGVGVGSNTQQRSDVLQNDIIDENNDIEILEDNDDEDDDFDEDEDFDENDNDSSRIYQFRSERKEDDLSDYVSGGGAKEGRRSIDNIYSSQMLNRKSSSALSGENQMRFKGEDLNIDGLEIRKLDVAGRLIDIYVCLLDNL